VDAGPFDFPAAAGDRLRAAAGAAETGLRRAVGRLVHPRGPRHGFAPPPAAALAAAEPPGRPLVYLAALPWRFRWQRPQQLALALGRQGHPVLYVEGFSRARWQPARAVVARSGEVAVLRVAVAGRADLFRRPPEPAAAAALAAVVAAGLRRPPLAVVAQLPAWGEVGRVLAERYAVPLLYDRIDLYDAGVDAAGAVAAAEERLLATADLVTASSADLGERSRAERSRSGQAGGADGAGVHPLPNAVALGDFPEPAPPRPGGRRAGFVGAVDRRFDVTAVEAAARALPGWSFAVAGGAEEAGARRLARLPNVTLAGEIPYRRVPAFLASLDLGLIPYRDLPETRAVDSVKLYEMLASGLPVVARDLPESRRWGEPLVYLFAAPEELPGLLERARSEDAPEHRRRRRQAVAAHTWERRAAALLALLPEAGGATAAAGGAPAAEAG
jgi:glycosyltransferase involved in cell wall biosynthesis